MALSPAASVRRSAGSSAASLRQSNNSKGSGSGSASGYGSGSRDHGRRRTHDHHDQHGSISIDTLVNHLLSAKRSLSSITLVVRGHELATQARASHEDATILSAQTAFLRSSIMDQAALLVRVRRALQATYDWAKRDFDKLLKQMDDVDRRLEKTMSSLRTTVVDGLLRPRDEEAPKTLIDFVDEESVFGIRDQMKKSIQELQSIQQSFDGDLLRFDTDIRNLRKSFSDPNQSTEADFEPSVPWTDRLVVLNEHSSNMAHLLTSLTKHFDLCVTAIRATDGAAALARRKAAEATQIQGHESVSISGVIAEHEAQMSELEPQTANDRAEMLKVVVQDAGEVDDVVREIRERLAALEAEYDALQADCQGTRQAYAVALGSHGALVEIGDRLGDYLAAEDDFRSRWDLEKDAVFVKLREMQELREFYERYADAYDGLVLEARRRRAVDEKIAAVWRKAQDGVDKILLADQAEREGFRTDVGEFLPTDLWAGMQGPPRRYEVVPVPTNTTTITTTTTAINDRRGEGRRAGEDGLG